MAPVGFRCPVADAAESPDCVLVERHVPQVQVTLATRNKLKATEEEGNKEKIREME